MNDCGKVVYANKKAAVTAANGALKRRRNRPAFLRTYWCDQCRGWHLTKKEEWE